MNRLSLKDHQLCFFLIFTTFLVLLMVGCNTSIKSVNKSSEVNGGKNIDPADTAIKADLKKAEITWVDINGKPVLKAGFSDGKASQDSKNAIVELKNVRAQLFDDGKFVSSLTAPYMTANNESHEINASGGIKVVSSKLDSSVSADKIVWRSNENKIIGTGNVKMSKTNISATATDFIADTALNKVSLKNSELILK